MPFIPIFSTDKSDVHVPLVNLNFAGLLKVLTRSYYLQYLIGYGFLGWDSDQCADFRFSNAGKSSIGNHIIASTLADPAPLLHLATLTPLRVNLLIWCECIM